MATLKELRDIRIEKIKKLEDIGINPYPATANRDFEIFDVTNNYSKYEDKSVTLVGRLFSIREHGSLIFSDLRDESGQIQLYVQEETLGKTDAKKQKIGFSDFSLLNVGDFVEARGKVTKTKRGEISLLVEHVGLLSKSVRPLPDEYSGLKNIEERYRKRYLDLLLNKDAKKILDIRWKIEEETRKFLWSKGFKEVETPVLQALYGGTNAKPFTTHFNALDTEFYLRVAPELYLKRLIVGGYEKVFEIARNFRNEGIDQTHFPEFTMLEWYEAYADYHRVMDLAEELTKHLVKVLTGGTKITVNGVEVDVGGTWPRVKVDDLLKEHLDISWDKVTDSDVKDLLEEHNINIRGTWDKDKALFTIYDHLIPEKLIDPIWVIDYPDAVSPLSKAHRETKGRAERFEGYIGGVEVFDGWSEIVSGLEQRSRFENEQKNMQEGDDEAMPLDEEFIEALEYGCPPLGGIGFGIERLVMFLTDVWSIKEVVAFPILKPRDGESVEDKVKSSDENSGNLVQEIDESDLSGLPTRNEAQKLLEDHVDEDYQKLHAKMVASVLEAYAKKLGENEDLWYITGLLHDLDYFKHPDEHPKKSLEWFEDWGYPKALIHAVSAHAHMRTGEKPQTKLAAYLIATDELAGLLYAYSLMRDTGFEGMKVKSAKKKFKDKAFARKVDREEIMYGVEHDLFDFDLGEHLEFMIGVFGS